MVLKIKLYPKLIKTHQDEDIKPKFEIENLSLKMSPMQPIPTDPWRYLLVSGLGVGFPIQASRVQKHQVATRSTLVFIFSSSIK